MRLTKTFAITILIVVGAVSCGGGGDGGGGGSGPVPGGGNPSSNLSATVTPDQPNPSSNTVSMAPVPGGAGSVFALNVLITQTNNVFGASFDVVYDPTLVNYIDWSQGNALEAGGSLVTYQVSSAQRGRVVVGISRAGSAPGVNITSTSKLIQLVFEVTQPGSSSLSFANAALHDPQLNLISGLSWRGATVTAN